MLNTQSILPQTFAACVLFCVLLFHSCIFMSCIFMSRIFSPSFSRLAISCPANWSDNFTSVIFTSSIFSAPECMSGAADSTSRQPASVYSLRYELRTSSGWCDWNDASSVLTGRWHGQHGQSHDDHVRTYVHPVIFSARQHIHRARICYRPSVSLSVCLSVCLSHGWMGALKMEDRIWGEVRRRDGSVKNGWS